MDTRGIFESYICSEYKDMLIKQALAVFFKIQVLVVG